MPTREIIKLESVWKTYTTGEVKVNALQGVNLSIKKGDFIAIQGPSGSGKSTMLNMIGSLDFPTKGKVLLKNKNIARLGDSKLAQIRGEQIGFIFQQFNLLEALTAKENVMLPMVFQDIAKQEMSKRSETILTKMGLGEKLENKPTQLSGGQQQRVAISRALANNPEVILADEPTGNLDSKTGSNVIHLLKQLNKEGKTIVMITHDDKIAKQAKKIIKIKDGKIEK